MAYNGAGTFLINSSGQPVVATTIITDTAFNALTADLATGLSTAITKNGQTTPTANIPLGGFKITNLATGTAGTDATNVTQVFVSPTFTGVPVAPTAVVLTNTTQIATTAFVTGGYAPIASPTFTGVPSGPTALPYDSTAQFATTGFVTISYAPKLNPAFTGTPTTPTAAPGTNTTQIASTAFVNAGFLKVGTQLSNYLAADVSLNNTALFFDGPSVAQGTSGTWFASGVITVYDTATSAIYVAKLWDGTTVIAATQITVTATGGRGSISLSGMLASPAGNIRISVQDVTNTSGVLTMNTTGTSKDSSVSVFRVA